MRASDLELKENKAIGIQGILEEVKVASPLLCC